MYLPAVFTVFVTDARSGTPSCQNRIQILTSWG